MARIKPYLTFLALLAFALPPRTGLQAATPGPSPVTARQLEAAFAQRQGAFVFIDCASGQITEFGAAAEDLPPCSTFKIWNTAIGLELGLISSPTEPFYKWDGKPQFLHAWERDLTLREAFQVSCVPAYQKLAREIGPGRMAEWLKKLGYGNGDISGGIDLFWLPAPGRTAILISPADQAELIRRLIVGDTPFSAKTRATLKLIMKARETPKGTLYGKTGSSGSDKNWSGGLGLYVGYVESQGTTYAFACDLQGNHAAGKDARALVEAVLEQSGLL